MQKVKSNGSIIKKVMVLSPRKTVKMFLSTTLRSNQMATEPLKRVRRLNLTFNRAPRASKP